MVHLWAVIEPNPSFLLILIFLSLLSPCTNTTNYYPIVNTKYGPIKGTRVTFSSTSSTLRHLDPVSAFYGIPYAAPPIKAYRFTPPISPLPWKEVRMATTPPPSCPQRFPNISNKTEALRHMTVQRYLFLQKLIPHLANQSEDCLYLNVFVPISQGEEIRPSRYPIVLVIPGESWEWGSGNEFDGAAFSSLGNQVVVTFNYRLGPLGFLKTSNQQSNFGLLDVIAALHWVKENGESFGGDTNRITLLGYKTGAVIANLLLVAQIAKGLFQRAILISGSVLSPWALQPHPEDIAKQLSSHLTCVGKLPLSHPESDLAPCLRRKSVSELIEFDPNSPKFLSPYAPYVDNVLLNNPKNVMEGQPSDQFIRAEILLIFTSSEGVHELNDHELRNGFESDHRDKILRTLIRNVFNYHQQEIFSIVRNEYTDWERPMLHPIPLRDSTLEALSDCLVIGPLLQVGMIHAKRGARTYVMHFSHVSKENEVNGFERLGSLEGDILPYVMGVPVTNNILGGGQNPFSFTNFSKQDVFVAETIIHYFSNFARTGDPNSNDPLSILSLSDDDWPITSPTNSKEQRRRSLTWDSYDPLTQYYLSLGAKPRLRSHYRGHKMALWLNLIPQIHLQGGPDVTLAHHTFQDDNPNLYIGPIRPLSFYPVGDQVPGFNGIHFIRDNHGSQTMPPSISMTTTECLESTDSPMSQGTRHSVLRMDSNEVEVEIRGNGGSDNVGSLSSFGVVNGVEYDYTTALTVTITVGVCLILLNLVVFSAIMCHNKKKSSNGSNNGESDTDSRRSSQGGTPQKNSYNPEDYKWSTTSCCSSNDFPTAHLSSYGHGPGGGEQPILMNQYHHPHNHPESSSNNFGTLPRSNPHPHYRENSGGGTLRRGGGGHGHGHHLHHHVSIPDCIQPVPNAVYEAPFPTDQNYGEQGSQMRLYMNQTAGENILDVIPPPEELQIQIQPQIRPLLSRPTVPISSPSATNTTNSTSSNQSPNSGSTTLVGVLKRHPTTPNSTVKKRVQIQEISV